MAFTYHELKAKNIGELRDIAKGIEHEAVHGYTQMNKDHLLLAVCKALNIAAHEHHEVVGFDKTAVKAKMRAVRKDRDKAIEARDHAKLKALRRQKHGLNREIRRHTV